MPMDEVTNRKGEEAVAPSQAATPRICNTKNSDTKEKITWVMLMGDSNMRHTYYWWSNKGGHNRYKFGIKGSSFGLDNKDKGIAYRWADQEILFRSEDDPSIVRYSFRFLHGSISEFVHDTQHWDVARKAAAELPSQWAINKMKDESDAKEEAPETAEGADETDDSIFWKSRVRPSDFSLWATKHKEPIDDN